MVKNPWANGILEHVHQVLGQMLCTAELDMADSVTPNDIDVSLNKAVWAIWSTYHTVLKASPGAAIFGRNMLFDISFVADWHKIGKGVVHAYVDQKLLKSNKIKNFNQRPKHRP